MQFKTVFIDLDDTIYSPSTGLWQMIKERIELYMQDRMGLDPEEIPSIRKELFTKYGTTMWGLKKTYGIDIQDYLRYVHDVPVEKLLEPDGSLLQVLRSIKLDKYIFTNADSLHATRILKTLGVLECFNGIIDILDLSPHCKPQQVAFEIAIRTAGIAYPQQGILVDDSLANTAMAKKLGMKSIFVGENGDSAEYDCKIIRIHDIGMAILDL